jgi:hypothetical protein
MGWGMGWDGMERFMQLHLREHLPAMYLRYLPTCENLTLAFPLAGRGNLDIYSTFCRNQLRFHGST